MAPRSSRDLRPPQGSSALERLRKWLTRQGASAREAGQLIEHIERFHTDVAGILHSVVAVGVSARKAEAGRYEIRLHLLWPDHVATQARRTRLAKEVGVRFGNSEAGLARNAFLVRLDCVDEIPREDDAQFMGLLGLTDEEEGTARRLERELQRVDAGLKAALRPGE